MLLFTAQICPWRPVVRRFTRRNRMVNSKCMCPSAAHLPHPRTPSVQVGLWSRMHCFCQLLDVANHRDPSVRRKNSYSRQTRVGTPIFSAGGELSAITHGLSFYSKKCNVLTKGQRNAWRNDIIGFVRLAKVATSLRWLLAQSCNTLETLANHSLRAAARAR